MTGSEVSRRLVDQRVRNRVMEEIWGLSRGDTEVRSCGAREWFECFFDYFPYDGDLGPQIPTGTDEEWAAIKEVVELMQMAIFTTPPRVTEDQLIDSGWPERIRPVAIRALELVAARGRFSEEVEEEDPSEPGWFPS